MNCSRCTGNQSVAIISYSAAEFAGIPAVNAISRSSRARITISLPLDGGVFTPVPENNGLAAECPIQ